MRLRSTLFLTALIGASSSAHAQTIIVDNVTIVDVSNGRLQAHKTIVVEGQTIARIETPNAKTRAAATLDGTGMFVIPGLWDMHVHAYFTNDSARHRATNEVMFPLFIVNGVTGVRDMGSRLDLVLAARDSIAAHRLIGPRMLVSGPMLDGPTTRYATPPYAAAIKVATADEARAAVRMLKERGVDMIKTQSLIPRVAYFAIADEAARLGIPFEGHVPDSVTAMEALAAHQRSFEHMIGVSDTATALIAALTKNQLWQCPTLINSGVGTAADFASDPGLVFWLRSMVEAWRTTAATRAAATDSAARARSEQFARWLALATTLHDAKIPFLAGTDAPQGYDLVPGTSLHRELQLFVRAGFTPLEALQTATLNPAKFFGRADWGAVGPGKTADLVILRQNPLVDIANTRTVAAVIADGRYYSPRELDRMRVRIIELAGK